jgi:hypothetical protein
VKKKILFVATLGVGVVVGIISQRILVDTPTTLAQTAPSSAPTQWLDTEEAMLARMNGFQDRLDQLEKVRPDSVEAISKQVEAQRGIEDLLTKFREAKQAKFTPFIGGTATAFAALFGAGGTFVSIFMWLVGLVAGRNSKKLQTGAGR